MCALKIKKLHRAGSIPVPFDLILPVYSTAKRSVGCGSGPERRNLTPLACSIQRTYPTTRYCTTDTPLQHQLAQESIIRNIFCVLVRIEPGTFYLVPARPNHCTNASSYRCKKQKLITCPTHTQINLAQKVDFSP